MEKILLGNSLNSLKTFREAVGIILHNALHPNIKRTARIKSHSEKQNTVGNLCSYAVNFQKLFFRLLKRHCLYRLQINFTAGNGFCKAFKILRPISCAEINFSVSKRICLYFLFIVFSQYFQFCFYIRLVYSFLLQSVLI